MLKKLFDHVDARDVLCTLGLALLAYGLWQVWPPLASLIPGAIVVYVAIFGMR